MSPRPAYLPLTGGVVSGSLAVATTLSAINFGVNASPTVGRMLLSGSGQGTPSLNTSGALTGSNIMVLDDSAAAGGAGGTILFSAAAQTWRFASIQGYATDGGNNTRGDITFSTRRVNTDATLTLAVRFEASGTCYNTSGSWAAISDASVKSDVRPYERGLDAVLALHPVSFRYNDRSPYPGDTTTRYGLIAQQVEPHVPEAVSSYTHHTAEKNEVELSTLDPTHMVYVLINAVREIKAELDALTLAMSGMK